MTTEAPTRETSAAVQDAARLDALRETGLLDSEVEEQFDRLTRLASKLLRAPATFFSLVDADRDFYKSCFGFAEPLASERELTGLTFCHYSMVSDGALVIPDTRADPAYARVPTVESMGVAAYLGVPVRAPGGEVLGSFCAIDFEPRDWTPLDVETMKELAKSAEREVAIRHWMRRQQEIMERERGARIDLEGVMESRARLIRGFTHDVKNPLGAADGSLALLEEQVLGSLSERQTESIARVRRSIRAALGLIDELIGIARAESDQLEMEREPIDLLGIVNDMVEDYRAQAESQGLRIEANLSDGLPLISSDGGRIRQILGNLLSNAVKYTHEGRVEVVARLEPAPPGHDGNGFVTVAVRDTGPGIAPENMSLLFSEFTRLEPNATAGAGLGLAISQRLAQALGGMISAESEPGHGSTFTLALPVHSS